MTIQYKIQLDSLGNACAITIIGQNISIPFDPANTDYQAYLKWLDDPNNQPLPADE